MITRAINVDVLSAVTEAGEAAGYWKAEPAEFHDKDHYMAGQPVDYRYVKDDGNRRFILRERSSTITCYVPNISSGVHSGAGIRVVKSDVRNPADPSALEASASIKRKPADIAKDLSRRVVSNEFAKAHIDAMHKILQERIEQRAAMLAHCEKLKALGYFFHFKQEPADDVYWEATMHATKGPTLRVNASGNCFIERISVDVENVVKLIQIAR